MTKGMTIGQMIGLGQGALEKYGEDYEHIGIRVQDHPEAVGSEIKHCSHIWDDGVDTGEELDGISAIDARADWLTGNSRYIGKYALILGGYRIERGEDDGEIIIKDAEVLECREL